MHRAPDGDVEDLHSPSIEEVPASGAVAAFAWNSAATRRILVLRQAERTQAIDHPAITARRLYARTARPLAGDEDA